MVNWFCGCVDAVGGFGLLTCGSSEGRSKLSKKHLGIKLDLYQKIFNPEHSLFLKKVKVLVSIFFVVD